MTKYTLIGLIALFGCTSDKTDTGETGAPADTDVDTDTDTDTEAAWDLVDFSGDCASDVCIYTMTTSRPAGLLELWIAETGDPSDSRWTETHDGFTLAATNDDGSETYELRLSWVTNFADQVKNVSTLLNPTVLGPNYTNWGDGLTWSFEASSPEGDFDCAVTGQDPAYYSERCTNVE